MTTPRAVVGHRIPPGFYQHQVLPLMVLVKQSQPLKAQIGPRPSVPNPKTEFLALHGFRI